MPIELAKDLVKKEFDLVAGSPEFSELQIDFIGGEPLLCFNMIKELAEWVWSCHQAVDYIHFATTNGTLLDDLMKAWFADHKKQFYLALSLDGSPETQEINRKGSSSRIDLEFFKRNWPDQGLKMTLSKESLPSLASDVIYLHKSGFGVSFNPANGVLWNDEDAKIFEIQLDILADYYLNHPKVLPATAFSQNFTVLLDNTRAPIKKYCGTGTYMVTYDVDGTPYPCHMFTPIVLGENRTEDLKRFDFFSENLVDSRCELCPFLRICPTCYGFNYKFRNNIILRDMGCCRMFKSQIAATCRFQLNRLAQKGLPSYREDLLETKALLYINDLLHELSVIQ
jgi:radical SAM protein with 4Fe4S-binding SPASM domain